MSGDPTAPVGEDVLLARAYLVRVAEPPAPAVSHLVELLGPVEAAARIRGGADLGPHVGAEVGARRYDDRSATDLAAARALGARLLVPEDPAWPTAAMAGFAGLPRHAEWVAPLALWVRGPASVNGLAATEARSVAVVGSRAASGYGKWVARDWSASFADAGLTVVSGAALGIDGEAHRGALAADGTTVAVLACGLDRAYPPSHGRLLEAIGSRGLIVSEYPVGAVPAKHRFLVRNRLIAALSTGTLLVESGRRSGAARTALAAQELGRPVLVVPGPVTSALSVGNHQLLRKGYATVVGSAADVVGDLAPLDGRAPLDDPARDGAPAPTDGLSGAAVRVHGALRGHAPQTVPALARESGVLPRTVVGALDELVAAGLVVPDGERGWSRSV
ncbi:DNA-processing protein DprA [Actinomycetospora sp. NBRC 106378]|uniref:DNA-processing protein DprA n=1 Tax=Actinomycetospora sp. NBRC 106378 TaxID=3032208 RepID=UPI0024A2E996|nr:DNA-processing protein DprA [Actinomycetospora sp. NBRC 106378]GLZ53581.1 putative DNA processing protein DprA [Actinomycetospora sp. NBRC 106378]